MKSFSVHSKVLWLVIVVTATLISLACFAGESKAIEKSKSMVQQGMLPSLVLGPKDIPWDNMALISLYTVSTEWTPLKYRSLSHGQARCETSWSGPFGKKRGVIHITIAIANSPEEAIQAVLEQAHSYAVTILEVTGDQAVIAFSDRAWGASSKMTDPCRGARVIFIRGNVIGDISMDHRGGFHPRLLFDLAARLGRKIDAARAGRPEQATVLPLAADGELHFDAWKMNNLGARLWGKNSTTIAIYDNNGIPRSLPAKRMADGDYLVPLRHIAAILGPRERAKIIGDKAKTTLFGKELAFERGKSEITVDQSSKKLNRTVQFVDLEVLVPLKSLVSNVLGKHITWEKRKTIMIGRVK